MDYRRLTDNDLADFAGNVVTLLGGSQLGGINAAVRTALVARSGLCRMTLKRRSRRPRLPRERGKLR